MASREDFRALAKEIRERKNNYTSARGDVGSALARDALEFALFGNVLTILSALDAAGREESKS